MLRSQDFQSKLEMIAQSVQGIFSRFVKEIMSYNVFCASQRNSG